MDKIPDLAHVRYNIPAVKGHANNLSILSIFQSKLSTNNKRSLLSYIYGGGQVGGTRFNGLDSVISVLSNKDDITLATIEYRLTPEYRAPTGAYNCYAGLVYLIDNCEKPGVDPSKVVVYGISGGGPLAAAICILVRSLKYP